MAKSPCVVLFAVQPRGRCSAQSLSDLLCSSGIIPWKWESSVNLLWLLPWLKSALQLQIPLSSSSIPHTLSQHQDSVQTWHWSSNFNVPTGSDVSQYLFVQDWGILHGLFSYSGCPKHCLYPKIALPILFVLWNAVRFLCHCQFFEFPCSWKAKHQKHTRLVNRPWWKSTVRGAKPDIHFGKAWFNSLSKADLCFNQAFSDRQCFLA